MICSKCGTEITVGRVCGKCGAIAGEETAENSTASGMRVTAYGAVVPENSGVYIASSLGMAAMAEDTGASAGSGSEEPPVLKDDDSVIPESVQSNPTESAYAQSPTSANVYTSAAEEDITIKEMAVNTESAVSSNTGMQGSAPADSEEDDTQKILERARMKTARTFSQSSNPSVTDHFDLNLEDPIVYNAANTKRKGKKRSSGVMRKIVPVILFLMIALISVPFIIKFVLQLNCDKQIKSIVTMVNEKDTSMEGVMGAVLPYFMADAYLEIQEICEGNIEYKETMVTSTADFSKAMTAFYSGFESSLKAKIGNYEELVYKIKKREALEKEECESIEKAYESMAILTEGLQVMYESMDGMSALTSAELQDLSEVIGGVGDKMTDMEISRGYVLEIELIAKGDESKGKDTLKVVVVRADKEWMIDYVSSVVINMEQYSDSYSLSQMDQFVDYEMNVTKLNEQLKRISEYMATNDMVSIYNMILNSY